MFNYYKLDIVPIILNIFKVKKIVLCGLSDKNILNPIVEYCQNYSGEYVCIDKMNSGETVIADYPLNVLPNLNNYDAVFLNDDPNWFTVFNELNFIKKNNAAFPLVFVCNNKFPHKRRDTYFDPKIIPNEFLNEYSKNLTHDNIIIKDGFFHALTENTSKNGVLTAIEDFISENSSVKIMDIKLSEGITILYSDDSISKIRFDKLKDEINGFELEHDDFNDIIIKNRLLTEHIIKSNNNVFENSDESESIKILENEIKLKNEELKLKDSKINNFDSKLNLKDTKIENFESKLVNKSDEINELNNHIAYLTSDFNKKETILINKISSLESDILQKEQLESELNNQISDNVKQLEYVNDSLKNKDNQIKLSQNELTETKNVLKSVKQQYTTQLSKLDNANYCISCYKEKIDSDSMEIDYLKKNQFIRKILTPLNYIYLIIKSNPKELSINLKLYQALKNSKCFDIGYYLNKNKDLKDSLWCRYLSPELHYVCNGFYEQREFNKKYFNRNSKKELLNYLIKCNYK